MRTQHKRDLMTRAVASHLRRGVVDNGPWQDRARCAEVPGDLMFPEKGEPTAPAKQVCMRCEVRVECLEDALDTGERFGVRGERFGVRGGMSERERRALLRRRESPPAEDPRVGEVRALAAGRLMDKDIAAQLGLTLHTVRHIRHNNGIAPGRPHQKRGAA